MIELRFSRARGAEFGRRIGDALAMPVHWYYNRGALRRDYGLVKDFQAPKEPHPDSIFWRSKWPAPRPELDILGSERQFWGKHNVHYHRNLAAGENTLSGKLGTELWRSLSACGGFDERDYLQRYVELLTHPERHRDTYLEEWHRGFFTNLGRGKKLEKCAIEEKHIGGLAVMTPVAIFYADRYEDGSEQALQCLKQTHAGRKMRVAAEAILSLLVPVLQGASLRETILEEIASQRNPYFGFPFRKWLSSADDDVIGPRLSTACYLEDAVPAVIYLALKYSDEPEEGLIANTNLGGDNVHRGSVLGALLGAECGDKAWPQRWIEGLVDWEGS
ncbi:MAG: ADP-ribosylglycohydrolase family protein [Verrucomicrobiota bacterium]